MWTVSIWDKEINKGVGNGLKDLSVNEGEFGNHAEWRIRDAEKLLFLWKYQVC